MTELRFTVYGIAQPQGSSRAFVPKGWTRPVITSDNKGLKAWRHLVADAASRAIQEQGGAMFSGPVEITAAFYLPRPKSLGKRTKAHTTKPDLDKLARSLGDALTGVVYNDDSQVTALELFKMYAPVDTAPHANIRIVSALGAREGAA